MRNRKFICEFRLEQQDHKCGKVRSNRVIAIIDYDAGNLKSVEKALMQIGQKAIITRNREEILGADRIILPGVGSFGVAMDKLYSYDLVDTIKQAVQTGKPFFGICLGMQLLFAGSEESEGVEGLGILEGEIVKIPKCGDLKIPHMGWNSIDITNNAKLFYGIPNNSYFYFVHSYYLRAKKEQDVAAKTNYCTLIHASVERDNVFGCQFHPEKSGKVGLQVLDNFANL